jgi:branched-chain amino acid transport system permease protein
MSQAIIINGLISSGVYALLALGFSLIFGVARIINLAHTAFYMVAAYLILTFAVSLGLNPYLSVVLSIIIVTVAGVLSYRLIIARVRQHDATLPIVTIALTIIIQQFILMGYGGSFVGVPSMISGYTTILGVKVTYQYLLTFGAVIVILLLVWVLLMKTKLGIAIRATAQDRQVANLMGINVAGVEMIAVGISVSLAAIAGALVAPLYVVSPGMWMHPLVMVLAVVVLGGLGSLPGSVVGALILGFAETLVVFLVPTGAYLKGAIALGIMIVVIMLRPSGLFGVSFEEER